MAELRDLYSGILDLIEINCRIDGISGLYCKVADHRGLYYKPRIPGLIGINCREADF